MTPKEKVFSYIESNIKKEKDKFAVGSKNELYKWEDLKEELSTHYVDKDYINELHLYKKFVESDKNYKELFKEWSSKK